MSNLTPSLTNPTPADIVVAMQRIRPQALYLGLDAIDKLVQFCREHGHSRLLIVADQKTYKALGERLLAALQAHSFDCKLVLFDGPEVVADAHHILTILTAANAEARTFLAVGSGTITDLTRFTSHRTGVPFISMPTALSVDGFTSIGAPTIVKGVKKTLIAQPPLAIFADMKTLQAAPRRLLAAGFGDMMGKFTSAADFALGHLLWDEPYDHEIAQRTRASAQQCVDHVAEIANASEMGIRALFDGLVESGYCMLDFGESRPASGAEHHVSHFIEMRLLQQKRAALYHGAKVGVAAIHVAQLYDAIKELSVKEVAHQLQYASIPDREDEETRIRHAYGSLSEEIKQTQQPFLKLSSAQFEALAQRIIEHWPHIQEIAAGVPSALELRRWIEAVGGPIDPNELGLTADEFGEAFNHGHYLRNRFTIRKLVHLFMPGIETTAPLNYRVPL